MRAERASRVRWQVCRREEEDSLGGECLGHRQRGLGTDVVKRGFPGGSEVKNPPANTGGAGLIPGLGRSIGEEMATHSSFLA